MRSTNLKIKGICLLLIMVFIFTTFAPPSSVQAASKHIKVNDFVKELVKGMKIKVSGNSNQSYINTAMDVGLLKEGDYDSYTSYLTRTDAAVLLNRADEILHGNTLDQKLIDIMLEKRISDIKKVTKSKRESVAKIMAKGIIKGYSNGHYIQNREFRGSKEITKAGALDCINLVLNPSKRAKLSYDGMLLRTTKLPKNYKDYDYILECYPNKFYERQFEFMRYTNLDWRTLPKDSYAYPSKMNNWKFKNNLKSWDFTVERDKYIDEWTKMAEEYLQLIFNVDYRTVDEKWSQSIQDVVVQSQISTVDHVNQYYFPKIKENKVIVESKIIAIEPSTLYYDGDYCMRAYVKYRIKAKSFSGEHNRLIYSDIALFNNLKSGIWREGIFDIRFSTTNGHTGNGSHFVVSTSSFFVDDYNKPIK